MKEVEGERNYGRKVIRDGKTVIRKKQPAAYVRMLLLIVIIACLLGAFLGSVITAIVVKKDSGQQAVKVSDAEVEIIQSKIYGQDEVQVKRNSFTWTGSEDLGFIPLDVDLDEELQEFTYCLCYCYNIDFALVMAQMQVESEFKANAVSSTGDYGLMQINEGNHEWLTETLGVKDFLDPKESIRSGIYVLRLLFEKYDDTSQVLMVYNMGESNAKKLWKNGITESKYSQEVMETAAEFRKELEERKGE